MVLEVLVILVTLVVLVALEVLDFLETLEILESLDARGAKAKKSRQRPTLARASPALPSAKEPLTSVFGMGTGVTTPLWPPAKNRIPVGN